ncbi:MAG TPA: NAD(P)H-binding protein, partial [Pseudohaliea sp.]|nr:NAD(P)H-binding protein [Pseudohaliea sp.]
MDVAQAPARALVFGASGYIGSNLVPYLARAGVPVRAAARSYEVLAARGWDGVELVQADALQPATLRAAVAGIDTAYYLVHSMAAGSAFTRLDLEAAANFAAAAAQAGVR